MGMKKSGHRSEEERILSQRMYFERCADFLALMIEKYGGEIEVPLPGEANPQPDEAGPNAA